MPENYNDWKEDAEVIKFHDDLANLLETDLVTPEDSGFTDVKDYLKFLLDESTNESKMSCEVYLDFYCKYMDILNKYQIALNTSKMNLVADIESYLNELQIKFSPRDYYKNQETYVKSLIKKFMKVNKKYINVNDNNKDTLMDIYKYLRQHKFINMSVYVKALQQINEFDKQLNLNMEEEEEFSNLYDSIKYLIGKSFEIEIPKQESEIKPFLKGILDIINQNYVNQYPDEIDINIILNFAKVAYQYEVLNENDYEELKQHFQELLFLDFQNKLTPLFLKKETNFPKFNNDIKSYLLEIDEELTRCFNENIISREKLEIFYKRLDILYDIYNIKVEENNTKITLEDIKENLVDILKDVSNLDLTIIDVENDIDYCEKAAYLLKDKKAKKIVSKMKKIVKHGKNKYNNEYTLNYILNLDETIISDEIDDLAYMIDDYFNPNNLLDYIKSGLSKIKLSKTIKVKDKKNVKEKKVNKKKKDYILEENLRSLFVALNSNKFSVSKIEVAQEILYEAGEYYYKEDQEFGFALSCLYELLTDIHILINQNKDLEKLTFEQILADSNNDIIKEKIEAIHTIIMNNNKFKLKNKKVKVKKNKPKVKTINQKEKISKKIQSECNSIYNFYLLCKKYGNLTKEQITGKQINKWFKKNEKRKNAFMALNDISEEMQVDIAYANQIANKVANKLDNIIKYNENGEITNESYLEYLKQKELEQSKLQSVTEELEDCLFITNNYVNMLENYNEQRLDKFKQYHNQIIKRRSIIAGISTLCSILVLSTGIGFISKNKQTVTLKGQDNISDEINNADININRPGTTIEENNPVENNELDIVISKAEEEINLAQSIIEKLPIENIDVITSLQSKIDNLKNSIMAKDIASIINNSNLLKQEIEYASSIDVNKEENNNITDNNDNQIITEDDEEKDYIAFGSKVYLNESNIYSNMYDATYEVNAKKTYYDIQDEDLNRSFDAIVFTNGSDVVLAYNDTEAQELLNNGYEVSGYRLTNIYSTNNIYEGYTNNENVMARKLTK